MEKVIKELKKFKEKDFQFKKGQILGSMCTLPHPVAKKAMTEFIDTNLGDPKLFPGTKEIEEKYIKFLKKILNAPEKSEVINGSGGTESNITAMWIAKNLSKKREVIVPESSHFSFKKIASLMDLKIRSINLDNKYTLNIDKLINTINENTAAVVGIAGSTELGTIDPIKEISDICRDEHIFLHVDAAFGGYVIPFLKKIGYKLPDFDFKLKGVSSISIDAHKMGCSCIPMGSLVLRNKEWLDEITVETPYISLKKQAGLLGTRPGGATVSAYAVAKYLGITGYKKIVKKCIKNTEYLHSKILEIGLKPVIKPTINVLSIKLKNPELIEEKLSEKGYKVNHLRRLSAIRIVLMPHIKKETIDKFIPILEKVCRENNEIKH